MKPQEALTRIIEHREIFHDEMLSLMRQIMRGELSPMLIAAIITGLRVKKETIGEIAAAAQVMREFATQVEVADNRHLWTHAGLAAMRPYFQHLHRRGLCRGCCRGASRQARRPLRFQQIGKRGCA